MVDLNRHQQECVRAILATPTLAQLNARLRAAFEHVEACWRGVDNCDSGTMLTAGERLDRAMRELTRVQVQHALALAERGES